MGWKKYLYVPLAGDLTHDETGAVVVGRRTRLCCDTVISCIRSSRCPEQASILFTAAQAGEEYGRVFMKDVMRGYARKRLGELKLHASLLDFTADGWGSIWEVLAAARFVEMQERAGCRFDRVVFVCEAWRRERTELLALAIFAGLELNPEVYIETFDSADGFLKRRIYWKIYEFFALYENEERLRDLLPTLIPARVQEARAKATAPP